VVPHTASSYARLVRRARTVTAAVILTVGAVVAAYAFSGGPGPCLANQASPHYTQGCIP